MGFVTSGRRALTVLMSWSVLGRSSVLIPCLILELPRFSQMQDPYNNTIACMHPIRPTRYPVGKVYYEFYFYKGGSGGAVSRAFWLLLGFTTLIFV